MQEDKAVSEQTRKGKTRMGRYKRRDKIRFDKTRKYRSGKRACAFLSRAFLSRWSLIGPGKKDNKTNKTRKQGKKDNKTNKTRQDCISRQDTRQIGTMQNDTKQDRKR
jgi:hypothetical protein